MARAAWDWESHIGRRIRLRDLHILTVVVRQGSMAKAASHLSVSQSVVSEAIASLEGALRVRLLDRSPHGIEPTIYADALLKRGHVVFDELRQGIRDIEFLADSTAGEVRLACPEILAAGFVPEVIEQVSRRHPQITVRVAEASIATLEFRQLRERSVDLIVTRIPGGFTDDDLDIEFLFDDRHFVVAGRRSKWARRPCVALADLAGASWIIPPSPVVQEVLEEAFGACGLAVPSEQVASSSILLRNRLLATGRFVTVLPDSALRYNAGPWGIKALPIDLRARPRPIAIVTLRHRTRSPVVELFMQQLRAAAGTFATGHG